MEDVSSREGRTVLFVSHNMGVVRSLCQKAICLDSGQIKYIGGVVEVSERYLSESQADDVVAGIENQISRLPVDPSFRLKVIQIVQRGVITNTVVNGEAVNVVITYAVLQRTRGLRIYVDLCDMDRSIIIRSFHDDDEDEVSDVMPGTYVSCVHIPPDLLAPKPYELRIYGTIFNERCVTPGGVGVTLYVERSNTINRAYPSDPVRAKLQPRLKWDTTAITNTNNSTNNIG